MTLVGRSLVVGAFALLVAGCGGAGRAHNAGQRTGTNMTSETTSSLSSRVSPCGSVGLPTTWSPSGKQVAWYGNRWPLPHLHHRPADVTVLRAICVSDADGKHVQPIRYTVCGEHCFRDLSDGADQLDWVGPRLLLYGNDFGIFAISVGRKPELRRREAARAVLHGLGRRSRRRRLLATSLLELRRTGDRPRRSVRKTCRQGRRKEVRQRRAEPFA